MSSVMILIILTFYKMFWEQNFYSHSMDYYVQGGRSRDKGCE
jgi:hypothetical protein